MRQYVAQRGFLLLLIVALLVGYTTWPATRFLLEWKWLREGTVAAVLFLMALPLDGLAIRQAVRQPLASLLATVVNMAAIPLASWAASGLLPMSLGHGLLVACATPCTLASASVWTRRAGGNDAVSLIVTVVTNLSCFVVTPFWLWLTTGNRITSEELSFADLGRSLAMLVVLPMVVAQVIRLLPRVAQWSSRQKIALNTLAQCGVLFMVFLGSIQMGFTMSQQGDGAWGIAVATTVLAVTVIHVGGFFAGWQLAQLFRLTREDRIAVGFAGSQKTLMVGLRVSMELGVSILPMVAYHISQLIADTILADYLIARTPAARQRDDADRLTVEQVRVQ